MSLDHDDDDCDDDDDDDYNYDYDYDAGLGRTRYDLPRVPSMQHARSRIGSSFSRPFV